MEVRPKRRTYPSWCVSIQSGFQLYRLLRWTVPDARPKIGQKGEKARRKVGSVTRILCIVSRVSTKNIFPLHTRRYSAQVSFPGLARGESRAKRPPSLQPLSLLSAGIHKKSYVLWGGDIPLAKKLQLGLAFDPLVRVNARLRGISAFPLLTCPLENFPFFSGCSVDSGLVLWLHKANIPQLDPPGGTIFSLDSWRGRKLAFPQIARVSCSHFLIFLIYTYFTRISLGGYSNFAE